ncbi:MAG: hypothetical protein COX62_07395 [Deltaproteobacteria bacterium CG_4_10_14_0_2_um_filter_43_8]|nr:MAG: hypothetical protein COV43_06140 [Deltaproteobacteria bacterium CG11_big_fil_rev_8_21_14_0_20_42_23]PJA19036.1 MAG: hypothetical protein COX62_07395 [Deltaproteobacteria bacterium CG_4_10_14_0_2_um_filter_43_8]PJC65172.1 MAG: hypothetical protein CO021_00535 [Deltaproteobacteria bacterium CG_4_9_14_0_2_um_filter_42_21]
MSLKYRHHIKKVDHTIIRSLSKYSHYIHRVSVGLFFIWMGLLKSLGYKTSTSLIAHTIYWGDPEFMVRFLGFWEIAIGVCLVVRPLVRLALLLLLVRLPGIMMAFILKADVCFYHFPFAPTLEDQFLIKDFIIFFAALAIASSLHEKSGPEKYH